MTDQAESGFAAGSAAALVIRVWRDAAQQTGISARITRQPDLTKDEQASTVVSSPDAVYEAVKTWLERFIEQTGPDDPDSGSPNTLS